MKLKISGDKDSGYSLELPDNVMKVLGWKAGTTLSLDVSMSYPGTLIVSTSETPAPTSGRTYDGRTDKSRT